jgi:hypothetical protein
MIYYHEAVEIGRGEIISEEHIVTLSRDSRGLRQERYFGLLGRFFSLSATVSHVFFSTFSQRLVFLKVFQRFLTIVLNCHKTHPSEFF